MLMLRRLEEDKIIPTEIKFLMGPVYRCACGCVTRYMQEGRLPKRADAGFGLWGGANGAAQQGGQHGVQDVKEGKEGERTGRWGRGFGVRMDERQVDERDKGTERRAETQQPSTNCRDTYIAEGTEQK